METVIMLPIIGLLFMFIWEFAIQARDQLVVAEVGLSAARLVGMNTTPANRGDFPDQIKDHRTNGCKLSLVGTGDHNHFRDVATTETLCVRDYVRSDRQNPWTMLVGGRAWYKGSDEARLPLWMEIGNNVIKVDDDDHRRRRNQLELRATVARVFTYSLARTAMSYKDSYPRHGAPGKLANSPVLWACDEHTMYRHMPQYSGNVGIGQRRTWCELARNNTYVRDDHTPDSVGGSMDSYTRQNRLKFISLAQQ